MSDLDTRFDWNGGSNGLQGLNIGLFRGAQFVTTPVDCFDILRATLGCRGDLFAKLTDVDIDHLVKRLVGAHPVDRIIDRILGNHLV